jgi:hypothetical protein
MAPIQLSRHVLTRIAGAGRRLLDPTERQFAELDPLRGNDSCGRSALGELPLLHLARVSRGRPVAAARIGSTRAATAEIASLPAYQVALWPDGWLLEPDGGVRVRDTHEMAEARRWLEMAARNRQGRSRAPMSDAEVARTMRLHRLFVPRAVIDLAGRRFASEQVASVALTLIAGEWIGERRRHLGRTPEQALAERARAWSGSRHAGAPDAQTMQELLHDVLEHCIAERLVPRAHYLLGVRTDDGYGIRCCLCRVDVDLDQHARTQVQEVLGAALIPWNRAVIRNGGAVPVIAVQVRCKVSGDPRADAELAR